MLPLHITGFPPSYIPYQRHPPCSLFPIEAHPLSGIIRGSQTWMIFEQPYDPISLGMDICILSRDTPETSRVGTVRACCVVVDSWVVDRVELHSALSAKTLLLYVPVIWVDVSSHVTGRSHIQEWAKFLWLGGVPPGVINKKLERADVPRSIPVWRQVMDHCRRSSETITPRSVGYSAA